MRRALFLATLLVALRALAFDGLQPICGLSCEPDPDSSVYGAAVVARTKSYNGRGRTAFTAPAPAGPGGPITPEYIPGSESYSSAIPLLSLPGRNGLDVNLALSYNSRIWTIDKVNNTATLNADRDFPSYGFRLGYGYLEYKSSDNFYIVTLGDGSKHQLQFVTTDTYDSKDSSYLRYYAGSTRILRFKNGTQIFYQQYPNPDFPNLYRPYRIQDTNGNHIIISYVTYVSGAWPIGHEISQITDTLNRTITFNYHATDHTLTNIQHSAPEGTRTYSFSWNLSKVINYNFTGLTVNDTASSRVPHTSRVCLCGFSPRTGKPAHITGLPSGPCLGAFQIGNAFSVDNPPAGAIESICELAHRYRSPLESKTGYLSSFSSKTWPKTSPLPPLFSKTRGRGIL